jgi:hypothetical protein
MKRNEFMTRIATVIGVLCLGSAVCARVWAEGKTTPVEKREMVQLRAIDTPDGPRVEMALGDMVLRASKLTFLREGKSDCEIQPVNGEVEIRTHAATGDNVLSAKLMEFPLRSGLFRRSPEKPR